MAVSAIVASTVATVASVDASKKQAYQQRVAAGKAQEATERQYAAEQKKADVQNVRSVRQQIRQSRLAQASMLNTGASSGGMFGSALQGGMGSVASQSAGNISYMSRIAQQNTAIGQAGLDAATAQYSVTPSADAAMWGAIGNLSSTIFQGYGGFKSMGANSATTPSPTKVT